MGKTKYPHKMVGEKEVKQCNTCGIEKELCFFTKRSVERDGLDKKCSSCVSEYKRNKYQNDKNFRLKLIARVREWEKNNPEKYKANKKKSRQRCIDKYQQYQRRYYRENKTKIHWQHIRLQYGIGEKEWMEIFKLQGNKCAICGSKEANIYSYHTDHNHNNGKIRGILCLRCNLLLSTWTEHMLQKCIDYIREK